MLMNHSFPNCSLVNDSDFVESLQNGFVQLAVWKEYLPQDHQYFYHYIYILL